jgi:peptide/nickel transport system substrate-binding protein
MKRRTILGASVGLLAIPHVVQSASERVLRFIPQSDLTILDPVFSSVYVTRNHAYMIFDTLYGQDSAFRPHPQMVEGATVERDGTQWRLRLRDGLLFHDNTPVLARDCVASIRRWARRDAFGQTLMFTTDELSAPDDLTIQFRLKAPFPMLPEALGKIGINMLPIMPERLAQTDPFKQVTEMIGSGPFRFLPDERISGARVAYARFEKYRPREQGLPDWTAGPKIVHFDRVIWNVIPDAATAAAALQRGEADWWEQPVFDLLPLLQQDPNLTTPLIEETGNIGFFAPNTPMASDAGLTALDGPHDAAAARAEIMSAGYNGEKVVIMVPGDYPRISALAQVAADLMKRCGLNVEQQEMDWGSLIQRRANKAPIAQGGWSVFITTFTGADMSNPASHLALRGNGNDSWFGWPVAPELERLRTAWLAAPDFASQKQIAAQIQQQAFVDVPFLPLGQFFQPSAQRKALVDGLKGMPMFWNVRPV